MIIEERREDRSIGERTHVSCDLSSRSDSYDLVWLLGLCDVDPFE